MDGSTRAAKDGLTKAAVASAEQLAGAASLLDMLAEKAEGGGGVTASELAAVRCVVQSCAEALDAAWQEG